MASELNVLAHALNRISERDRRYRDFTLNSCRAVLREVIACFPVYRTYVSARGVSAFDREAVGAAIRHARRRNPLMEASIFEFLEDILLPTPEAAADPGGRERQQFAMHVQQFTAPVQAKGVEDTAFYRYHVLASVNEVGGNPGRLGVTPAEFHEANARRLASWRASMITTATHDTKRGEDARMRINVLSEIPEAWRRAVAEWMRINGRHRSKIGGAWAPDRNDEYLFYQTLVGVWPAAPARDPIPARADAALVVRMRDYMLKAVREAKVHTSWIDEDPEYSPAVARFVERVLDGATAARFLRAFTPFARDVARVGMVNSLAQVVLKLASPGVADVYQGTELWDLSLVDPDNRGDVDFARRRRQLGALLPAIKAVEDGGAIGPELTALLDRWAEGDIKLLVLAAGLRFRRRHAAVVIDGDYTPLPVDGPAADHLVAFARTHASGTLVAIVPRLVASLTEGRPLPLGDATWGTTRIVLPDAVGGECYRHVLTGESVRAARDAGGRSIAAAHVFRTSPVALLWAAPAPAR